MPSRSFGGLLLVTLGLSVAGGAAGRSQPSPAPAVHATPQVEPGRTLTARPVTRRLNRAEYANAVRDLFGVDIDAAVLFPADSTVGGFDTAGAALSLSPLLLERYLSAARSISRRVVGSPAAAAGSASQTYEAPKVAFQDGRMDDDLPFGSRGGLAVTHHFPVDGEYLVRVQLRRNVLGYVRGLHDAHRMEVRLDGTRLAVRPVGGAPAGAPAPLGFTGVFLGDPAWEAQALTADADLTFRTRVTAGDHRVAATFVDEPLEVEGVLQPPLTGLGLGFSEFSSTPSGPWGPSIDAIAIEGPLAAVSPAKAASTARWSGCTPSAPDADACVRRRLTELATRAYRGLATTIDVDHLFERYRAARNADGFAAGLEAALERLLVDPKFLFRLERDPPDAQPSGDYPVSDVDLASRLSFFIWSSIPDDRLLQLARDGQLGSRATLDAEVTRLLADARASALVDRFAMQWLGLTALRPVTLDSEILSEYDGNLRDAFLRETRLFVADQLRADKSVADLLTARYTYVNERLARHYGIPGVYGTHFRRVAVAEDRAGLLGHGSILTVTSYPTRTSPVLRGRWVLDTLLGAPPPPPPPSIPPLPGRVEGDTVLTLRQRTERHRRSPACAGCHVRMDPLGFSLEGFDAIGRVRTADEEGASIDARATLPDGVAFDGMAGLRAYLTRDPQVFAGALTGKLLGYAMGRPLADADQGVVAAIVSAAAPSGYRWSAVIRGIVHSPPFRRRQVSS